MGHLHVGYEEAQAEKKEERSKVLSLFSPVNLEEVRAALRNLDRRLRSVGGTAASAAIPPSIKEIITRHGGLIQRREKGKLLATDKYDVWFGLEAADSNGLALVSDSSVDLGLTWRLVGEIPIAMRFADSAQSF